MPKKIQVVIVEPDKPPRVETVEATFDSFKSIVGGYTDAVWLGTQGKYRLVFNRDQDDESLPFNFKFDGKAIRGTVFVARYFFLNDVTSLVGQDLANVLHTMQVLTGRK